jgi:hypothetical protein
MSLTPSVETPEVLDNCGIITAGEERTAYSIKYNASENTQATMKARAAVSVWVRGRSVVAFKEKRP